MAGQHVNQLREFIELIFSQKTPRTGNPPVILADSQLAAGFRALSIPSSQQLKLPWPFVVLVFTVEYFFDMFFEDGEIVLYRIPNCIGINTKIIMY